MAAFVPMLSVAPPRSSTLSRPRLSGPPPAASLASPAPAVPRFSSADSPYPRPRIPSSAIPKRKLLCGNTPRHTSLGWRCSLPRSYDHLDSEAGQSDNSWSLAWKDRVALYAQFSAEETLDMLLLALKANSWSGPTKDDGIDALYAFANVDIWALTHRFFGRKMDLGQFERFKRVLVASPYDVLLRHRRIRTLSALKINEETYISRRVFEAPGRVDSIFTFTMSRASFGVSRKELTEAFGSLSTTFISRYLDSEPFHDQEEVCEYNVQVFGYFAQHLIDDRNWRGNLKYTFRTASYSLKGNFAALRMSETQEEFNESVSQSTANLGKVESRPSDR